MHVAAQERPCDNWHMSENIIGKRVAALRKRLKLSQELVGERGGLARDVVNKIENGGNKLTSHDARKKLALGLGITPASLDSYLDGAAPLESVAASAERDESATPAHVPADPPTPIGSGGAAFERALGVAFRSGEFELVDLDAVRLVLRGGAAMLEGLPRLEDAARALLRGAALLRAESREVTYATLVWAATTEAQDAAMNAEAQSELRALGGTAPEEPVRVPSKTAAKR